MLDEGQSSRDHKVAQAGCSTTWLSAARRGQTALVLLLVFSALSLSLIIRNLSLQYPSVLGDEYYYSILSRYFGNSAALFAHNRYLPDCPNELYLWLFGIMRLFRGSFYQAAKTFNSVIFAAAIFPLYATARLFLRRGPALLVSTLIVVAPIESYTAYFMPEPCYFLGFWLFTYFFISNLPRRAFKAGLWGGLLLGLLVLIKPHALAILAAADLTLVMMVLLPESFDLARRDAALCLAVVNIVFLVVVVTMHVGFFGHRDLDIIGYYRGFRSVPIPHRLVYVKQVLVVALGHLAYTAPIFGLPIVTTVLGAFGWLSAERPENRGRLRTLTVFAILLGGLLLGMTAAVTVVIALGNKTPAELLRLHGRYYNFLLPAYLISFYALMSTGHRGSCRKALAGGTLASLVLALLGWRLFAPRLTVYLADYPEMAWLTQPSPIAGSLFWAVTAAVLIYYLIRGFAETATYSRYVVLTLIVGAVLIFAAQHKFDQQIPADRGAALLRELVDGGERDLGVVVGSDLVRISRCLFGIQANPSVLLLPHGAVIAPVEIGKEDRWLLALDDYEVRVPSVTMFVGPKLKIVRLLQASVKQASQQ